MKAFPMIALLAALAAPAAASAEDAMTSMSMSASGTPADKAFTSAMQTMMRTMHVKPTGQPDRDFVTMMMPHHRGAVDMARIELQYGKDPELRKLAEDIVKAQEQEIDAMKAWLGRHPG